MSDQEREERAACGILTNQVHYAKGTHMQIEVAHLRTVLLALARVGGADKFNIQTHDLRKR